MKSFGSVLSQSCCVCQCPLQEHDQRTSCSSQASTSREISSGNLSVNKRRSYSRLEVSLSKLNTMGRESSRISLCNLHSASLEQAYQFLREMLRLVSLIRASRNDIPAELSPEPIPHALSISRNSKKQTYTRESHCRESKGGPQ
jgi:hypothetical protein